MGYDPSPWMIIPFGLLLTVIALAPLFFPQWWSKGYPLVACSLGAVTLVYYLFVLPSAARHTAAHTGLEYVSFIALVGSLFVVSGGIHISVKGEATPRLNTAFLFVGAVTANVLGTTGASMLLIRPWLRMNKYRITAHHVVFFIFIVSNVGGCLTPIGDPPLFLGYLKGVPFWWVAEHCWPMWLVGVGLLLVVFYIVDRRNYLRAPPSVRAAVAEPPDQWRLEGGSNFIFLALILFAVFIEKPLLLREVVMFGAALGSYTTTRRRVHAANHFNFHPLIEVAVLFLGIFATMMPALDWLRLHGSELRRASAGFFFWSSGSLSSVLDNAPTYLSFLNTLFGAFVPAELVPALQDFLQKGAAPPPELAEAVTRTSLCLQKYYGPSSSLKSLSPEKIQVAYLISDPQLVRYLVAISVGAVFFGAMTYIGNGPNFMVKSIAEHQKVRTPTFLGYFFSFALPFMVPMLIVIWLLFFR